MNTSLKGKAAIVCGGSRGLGKASAFELARLGAVVTVVARNETALKRVCLELPPAAGRSHEYLVADFSEPLLLQRKMKEYVASRPPVHILVNNTAGPIGGPILDATIEDFLTAFSMHLLCNHVMVQAAVPGMKAAGYGRIVNIISTSVRQPIPGLGVSNTTRGAVASWAKTLAGELAPFGITVNSVLPGMTKTDRLASLIAAKSEKTGRTKDDVAKEMLAEVPAGRFAEPEELANTVAFLATPAAAYITGVSLPVDGNRISAL